MGKGGGSASTPTVIPDNLKNKQFLRAVDLITEGQIEGPVGGLRGILINNTPVEATDGTVNIKGVSVEWKAGTQSQEPLVGFNDIENEVSVGVEVKFNEPVTRTVSDVDVDRVRFTVGVNQLVYTDDQGDQGRTSVSMSLQFFENGTWTTKKVVDINGKTSTTYLESHIIDAPSVKPFQIRVIRNTPDSTNERLINTTIWSSYTELTNARLSYPNSAVVGIVIDRSQFSGTPSRTYHIRGKIIKVPDNYDPVTRTYDGIWTGNFKLAYTNNPAWVFYDLVINERYGLGKRLGSFNVNKFTMYAIGQYCDVKVPDGLGGEEPRFTCNAIIAEQRKAIDTLSDMASVFRAMPVWDGLQLTCVQDRPTDKEWTYTNASVIDGKFIRSSSALKARHTAIEVSWINPDNGWKSEIEYVADDELIKRFGYNVNKVAAFGCTSRGQANRVGRWILETEKLETKTIKFSVAMEGLNSQPGDMIEVADNDYAIAKVGGRVVSFSGNSITLDAPVEILAGESASFSYLSASGKFDKIAISGHPSPDVITLSSVPNGLKQWGVFSISKASLSTQLYRVSTIAGPDNGIYSIIAVQHEPQKEAIVDRGANFEGVPSTLASVRVPNIEKLRIGSIPDSTLAQAKAIWETVTINRGITFDVRVLRDGREVSSGNTAEFEYYFNGLDAGAYEVAVRGRDERGMLGEESAVNMIIGAPAAPSRVDIIEGFLQLTLTPHITAPQTFATQFEFWFSGENKIPNINDIETIAVRLGRGPFWVKDALKAGHKYYFYIRSINEWGKSAFIEAAGTPSIDAGGIIDTVLDNFSQTSAGKELFSKIELNTDSIIENSISNDADAVSKWEQYGENRAGIFEVRKSQVDSERAFAIYKELVTVRFNGVDASIYDVRTAQATTDRALAEFKTHTAVKFGEQTAEINEVRIAQSTTDSALAEFKTQTAVKFGEQTATINEVRIAQSTTDSALAEFKTQTGVKFNQQDAVIQTKATTVFDSSGVHAVYSVKAGVNYNGNYYDAGMVIGVDVSGGTIKSQVGFNADTFMIIDGPYGAKTSPFVVTNGQVFIKEAIIRDGTITNAKIGQYIQSFDYNPGYSGWIINKDGSSEFSNGTFRGTIYAHAGVFSGRIESNDGYFSGTVYARNISGDIVNIYPRSRKTFSQSVPPHGYIDVPLFKVKRDEFTKTLIGNGRGINPFIVSTNNNYVRSTFYFDDVEVRVGSNESPNIREDIHINVEPGVSYATFKVRFTNVHDQQSNAFLDVDGDIFYFKYSDSIIAL